ncbi:MAG: cytochrome c3 family protein [Anaerolineales bacterium]|jgi:hypothetical protein|nr:cytochrome c3 family protein [Anaerolineales bacterium]|tara:strand:+ start:103 stop:573 length:471 start_codon:yes stop_codon:yes gene_type:complete
MDRNTALRITFSVIIVAAIIVITITIATSFSISGIAYSSDPEACASCHIEAPYVEGWRDSPHDEGNITCMDCHQYRIIGDQECLTCHEDYDATNSTQFLWSSIGRLREIDSHLNPSHIPAKCTTCHMEHKFELGIPRPVTESLCNTCHLKYIPPEP